jgi:hypothetical protein
MLYTGLDLLDLKRFTPRFGPSSIVRLFLMEGDLLVTNAGTETPCFAALETKYSKIRAVGLYFLTENFESAAEMSLLSSSAKIEGTIRQRDGLPLVVCLCQDGKLEVGDLCRDALVNP